MIEQKGKLWQLITSGFSGTAGAVLMDATSNIQNDIMAAAGRRMEVYGEFCAKYGKTVIDSLLSWGKDAGLSLGILGFYGVMSYFSSQNKEAKTNLRFCMSLVTLGFSINELLELVSPELHQVCHQTGKMCGDPVDLVCFAVPLVAILADTTVDLIKDKVKSGRTHTAA